MNLELIPNDLSFKETMEIFFTDEKYNNISTGIAKKEYETSLYYTLQGVLAGNNKIFFAPNENTSEYGGKFYEFNIETKTIRVVNNLSGASYTKGILAEDGNIYYIPNGHSNFMEFNPYTYGLKFHTTSLLNFYTATYGGNNKIYCIPRISSQATEKKVYIFNTETKTVSTINTNIVQQYTKGVLAPNGKIYYGDLYSNSYLVIDTKTDSVKVINYTEYTNSSKVINVFIKKNQNVVLLSESYYIVEIDTTNDTYTFLNTPCPSYTGFSSYMSDGNFYVITSYFIYKWDDESNSFEKFNKGYYVLSNDKMGNIAPDGKIYYLDNNSYLYSFDPFIGKLTMSQCICPYLSANN